MKDSYESSPAYFAAANSYDGFKSYFGDIFSPKDFNRIYVLKGGPGTGKSTLMKRILKTFSKHDVSKTRFFCSSDPSSLDGILLSRRGKNIAIVDGTAPHTVDCEYPGAVEVIINLADGLNTAKLSAKKDEIIQLTQAKKDAYKKAYEYLKTCGSIHKLIMDKIKNSNINSEAECIADQIMQYELFNVKQKNIFDKYLVTAFCKDGYYRLDIPCIEKEYISLTGDGFTEQIVMSVLYDKLSSEQAIKFIARSPFTSQNLDLLVTSSCIISNDNTGCTVIDTSPLSRHLDKEYKSLYSSYKQILELSQNCFKKASEFHFMLEDIYSENIDFTYNDNIAHRLECDISDLLL